ncbi:MAG: hypothetical protein GY789_00070 [Hyphomicrobiales bacterium]|nr:hypothetical protein [Hyphomicrobiales bacterium]MCP4998782.1 hypothetical protein [Hyphomicrobiales bacterium]
MNTPSGKIEIFSKTIASIDGSQLFAHPAWYPPVEWLGNANDKHSFHLISNQPAEKLHSQLDHGPESRMHKRNCRTPLHINPTDARNLIINVGNTVRVYNIRGACLATATVDKSLMNGVLKMSTGAWLDDALQADGTLLCRHGNPNTLTRDFGTSNLAQGPTAHSYLVAIEAHRGDEGTIEAFVAPSIE